MPSIYARGPRLWMRVKIANKWASKRTPFLVGDEGKAQRYADEAQKTIDERAPGAPSPVNTVRAYALGPWLDARREAEEDWQSDRGRLENHVLPAIGDLALDEVQPKHLAAIVRHMRFKAGLAPRTVRNVYFVAAAMFRDAAIEGRIKTSPCILTAAHLGTVVDSDPEWRAGALFTRDEAEQLIADPRIPIDRRVVYGLGLLAGLRPGEGAALRLRHYSPDVEPLGRLLVATAYSTDRSRLKRTKTESVKHVPVHPALAELLDVWIRAGWAAMVGRAPGPDDLLVPLPPETAERRTRRTGEPFRGWDYTGKRWRDDDLPMLGWRRRSVYDTRATFISLAVDDGADEEILRSRITHTKPRRDAFDGYNRIGPHWGETCAEVAKLRIVYRGAPEQAGFSRSLVRSASDSAHVTVLPNSGALATPFATRSGSSSENAGSGGGSRTPDDVASRRGGLRVLDGGRGRIATEHDQSLQQLVASVSHSVGRRR